MKAAVKWNPCISQLTSLAMLTPGQEIQIIIWWHYQHLCYSSLDPPIPTNHDREWWCIFLCLFQCVGLFCFVLITKRLKSEAELIYTCQNSASATRYSIWLVVYSASGENTHWRETWQNISYPSCVCPPSKQFIICWSSQLVWPLPQFTCFVSSLIQLFIYLVSASANHSTKYPVILL